MIIGGSTNSAVFHCMKRGNAEDTVNKSFKITDPQIPRPGKNEWLYQKSFPFRGH